MGPWVAGSLLLVDLGFYGYRLFAQIHENWRFFVFHVKKGSNLTIAAVHSPMPQNQRDALIGQDLFSVIPGLDAQSFDAAVSVLLKRRAYRGNGGKNSIRSGVSAGSTRTPGMALLLDQPRSG